MRALPAEPSAGGAALQVHLGDSLLAGEDRGSLFGHVEGSMRLVTPEEREILIPVEFVRRDGFADRMRRLVDAAASRRPLPPAVLHGVPRQRREDLLRSRDELEAAIGEEGNSVWTWYAVNIAAPHLLSERKVDRIVANPPWVKLAHIQEPVRKRAMEKLGERLGLQAGGKQSPHLDIASFFVLRARELYLNAPKSDPAVWLVKKSALRAGHWRLFRKKHERTLSQSVDLETLLPFGGGDARRCCLLMEQLQLANQPLRQVRQRPPEGQRALERVPRLEARLRSLPEAPGRPKRPKPEDLWPAVRPRLQFAAVPDSLPQARSGYRPADFKQGATVVPHVLLVAERSSPSFGRIRVRTLKSQHPPWSEIPQQEVEIPKQWLSKLYRSVEMLPFVASSGNTQAIIPVDRQRELDLESATSEAAWRHLNKIYEQHRGQGKSTPRTLARQIDFAGKLSSQPRLRTSARRMVLYPTSGDIMRAARSAAGSGFVDNTLYWHDAGSETEAGYLVSLLNAPSLQRAFRESRTSGRHFHLHPWRRVPVPRYDSGDIRHARLADLCEHAEEAARVAAEEAQAKFPNAGTSKLSSAVRGRLEAEGIFRSIDEMAAQLLPDQAETEPH